MNPLSTWTLPPPGGSVGDWSGALPLVCAGNSLFLIGRLTDRGDRPPGPGRPAVTPRAAICWLLLGFMAWSASASLQGPDAGAPPTQLLNLLTGLFLAQFALAAWRRLGPRLETVSPRTRLLAAALLEIPALGLLYGSGEGHDYYYHSVHRLRGMFQNPNTAGLFAVLNLLLLARVLASARAPSAGLAPLHVLLGLETGLHLFALAASGSRGAWIALLAALVCLAFSGAGRARLRHGAGPFRRGDARPRRPRAALVLAAALLLLAGLGARHGVYARRLASLLDPNDFSARNRSLASLLAAKAAFQSFPHGWGLENAGTALQTYYSPQPFAENLPFHLNSFALLAAGLGLPALLLLGAAGLIALGSRRDPDAPARPTPFWRAALCAVGAACAFDGGLFLIPGAFAFWTPLLFAADGADRLPRPGVSVSALALVLSGSLWLRALAPALSNPEAVTFQQLCYAGGDGVRRHGCLGRPLGSAPRGLVLFAHGSGTRWYDDGAMLRAFAARGYLCATFDFRAGDQAAFHADFAAFREYLVRTEDLGRWPAVWCGDSWGAYEALLETIQSGGPKPRALVCLSGPWPSVDSLLREAVAAPSAGPQRAGARAGTRTTPILLVHGAEDQLFPASACYQIAELLSGSGLRPSLGVVPAWGHVPDASLGLIVGRVVARLDKLDAGSPGSGEAEPGLPGLRLTSYGTFLRDVQLSVWIVLGAAGIFVLGLSFRPRREHSPSNNTNMSKLGVAFGVILILAGMAAAWNSSGRPGWRGAPRREAADGAALTLYQWNVMAKDWHSPAQTRRAFAELLKSGPAAGAAGSEGLADPVELSWRRPLWELFIPMVRSSASQFDAARVVACYLSQFKPEVAVEVVPGRFFEGRGPVRVPVVRLYAAALRALAVPARERGGGVEIWADGGWAAAPPLKTFGFVEL